MSLPLPSWPKSAKKQASARKLEPAQNSFGRLWYVFMSGRVAIAGVLIMDIKGMVRSANPAARRLLAAQSDRYPAPFDLAAQAAWQPLTDLMQRTFKIQTEQETSISLAPFGRSDQKTACTLAPDGLAGGYA